MSSIKSRSPVLDIIRILAFCAVIGVHFFLNTSFYSTTIQYPIHFLMIITRTACMVCVPFFMLLTGYLMNKKTLNKKYYIGIIKTIGIYVLASFLCYINSIIFSNNDFDFLSFIVKLLSFNAAEYAWYIEMYIGLFLIIPFLNIIYNSLNSQKQKKVLILTFIVLTAIPSVSNFFDISFILPFLSNIPSNHSTIVPDWWTRIYPITYYFIGAYIKEFATKISSIKAFVVFICTLIFTSAYCFYRSQNLNFSTGQLQEWGALSIVILSVSLFIAINNIKLDKVPIKLGKILTYISNLTLCAYLVSEIFDKLIYNVLTDYFESMEEQFKYYLPCVFIIICLSLLTSSVINFIYQSIVEMIVKVLNKNNAKERSEK